MLPLPLPSSLILTVSQSVSLPVTYESARSAWTHAHPSISSSQACTVPARRQAYVHANTHTMITLAGWREKGGGRQPLTHSLQSPSLLRTTRLHCILLYHIRLRSVLQPGGPGPAQQTHTTQEKHWQSAAEPLPVAHSIEQASTPPHPPHNCTDTSEQVPTSGGA